MEARVFSLTCAAPPLSPTPSSSSSHTRLWSSQLKPKYVSVLRKSMKKEEPVLEGLPKEYYDDEWQAQQREKTKELNRRRQEEDEEEERKVEEYREIGMRLKDYPEEDVRNARKLISSFIRAAEEVEEKIEEAAEKGELTELVLMVIWNRLDLARRDDEKDVIRSLDLLYRRVEAEILKREATPAMRLLNDLLNMHDGFDGEGWLKECKKRMIDTFPREDPFSILVPAGFDIDKHEGPLRLPVEADDALLRVDFVREVDVLLQEVRAEQSEVQNEAQNAQGLDPEAIANRLKQQEKQRAIRLEKALEFTWNLQQWPMCYYTGATSFWLQTEHNCGTSFRKQINPPVVRQLARRQLRKNLEIEEPCRPNGTIPYLPAVEAE